MVNTVLFLVWTACSLFMCTLLLRHCCECLFNFVPDEAVHPCSLLVSVCLQASRSVNWWRMVLSFASLLRSTPALAAARTHWHAAREDTWESVSSNCRICLLGGKSLTWRSVFKIYLCKRGCNCADCLWMSKLTTHFNGCINWMNEQGIVFKYLMTGLVD